MRLAPLDRRAAPLVVALPILVAGVAAGLLTGPGPWWGLGESNDTVRAVTVDGSLGVDDGDPVTDPGDFEGAHPVDHLGDGVGIELAVAHDGSPSADLSDTALPARVLAAYRNAATAMASSDPGCHLTWPLLAGIGKVESGHARGGAVDDTGLTLSPILGPVLDGGPGVAAISDTDGGRWDRDSTWDRAVGPMQFIPSSWQIHGADGNGDGDSDPNNVMDAALASAGYLCAGDRDLQVERDRRAAVFSYNHSWDYVDLVLAWADAYAEGTPVLTGDLPVLASAGGGSGRGGDDRRAPSDPATALTPGTAPTSPTTTPLPADTRSGTVDASTPAASADPAEPPAPDPTPAQTPPNNPSPSATPTPAPTCPSPSGSPSPTGTASPTGSPSPDASPTASSSATPSPSATDPSATPTASPSPRPSETC